MAIYLLKEETKYLLDLLKKQPDWWVKDKLIEKIQDDIEQKENRQKCNHEFGEYKGIKTCCTRCGGYAEGMGESWELVKNVDPKDYEMPKYKTPLENLIG